MAIRALWVGLLLMSLPFSVPAASAEDEITLSETIVRVLQHNPTIQAMDYRAGATAARIEQASQAPPWRVGLELENVAGTGVYSGTDRLQSTLSLAKVLELGDKPEQRTEVARARAGLLQDELSAQRLDIVATASRRYLQVLILQQRIALIEQARQTRQQTLQSVSQRVEAGRSPTAERFRAQNALDQTRLELQRQRHALEVARLKLANMWGAASAGFGALSADLYDLPSPEPFDTLKARLAANPRIAQFATEQRLAEARYRLAQSRRSLDVQLRGGVRHQRQTDDAALVFSFSVPLGSGSRAEPYIDEAQQRHRQQPYEQEQQRLALLSALYEAYQEMRYAYTALETLQESIIPGAERALRDYRRGYQRGRYSLLELNDAEQALIDSRLERVATAATYHRARFEIERLTGTAVQTGVSQ
ncbi:TolC family protein [Thiohalophilus thiocyanatoxydans]|uniref:Cobalt-zinc-cadmium efflux system outer membrane protein n=1 Tax=Thiohalophilus thiocyanatoxydans TaxID=381308 RepID=A0A4R8IZG7_9GAMM|nr:TolC family protein [Thiohalophilus thiocyanatoxydans]TDY02853.1 cobalt-zinc-cadmium efflux system outer membrane protein [Thiohalophilus thiocyanatoxydans]